MARFPGQGAALAAACLTLSVCPALAEPAAGNTREPGPAQSHRRPPRPLSNHPGNIHLDGERVEVRLPEPFPPGIDRWRLVDDRGRLLQEGRWEVDQGPRSGIIDFGPLGIGWYRVEFGSVTEPVRVWTTAAVLRPLVAPVPADSPVGLDLAASWLAREGEVGVRELANLAALAGVNWVRDRVRWRDLQPKPGQLVPAPTPYDVAARVQSEAGLQLLQVFHDTPGWAQEPDGEGGRFAPDLRAVHQFARALAGRFRGRVQAWEPWNEANVATFGGHTVDEMCSWQKAAWLGFKSGDPLVTVGWNVTTTVPTPAQTFGILANETWPYFDTYNIHSYDWAHSYAGLWGPALAAACGRPLWITEADRGTPHLKNAPWYDQEPRLELLKAHWIPQAYASSLFAGASRHFHFILGNYQEPNGVQFGLLRHDLSPRPAYVALATVGRCLAGARPLGRWLPGKDVNVYAFAAQPDGQDRDVLVAWVERDVGWGERGNATAAWPLPSAIQPVGMVDYLGRSLDPSSRPPLGSAPVFVLLPRGQAAALQLETPRKVAPSRPGESTSLVLQLRRSALGTVRVEDLPWSEGYAHQAVVGGSNALEVFVYQFGREAADGALSVVQTPVGWQVDFPNPVCQVGPSGATLVRGQLRIDPGSTIRDGWVVLRGDFGTVERPVLAVRFVVSPHN